MKDLPCWSRASFEGPSRNTVPAIETCVVELICAPDTTNVPSSANTIVDVSLPALETTATVPSGSVAESFQLSNVVTAAPFAAIVTRTPPVTPATSICPAPAGAAPANALAADALSTTHEPTAHVAPDVPTVAGGVLATTVDETGLTAVRGAVGELGRFVDATAGVVTGTAEVVGAAVVTGGVVAATAVLGDSKMTGIGVGGGGSVVATTITGSISIVVEGTSVVVAACVVSAGAESSGAAPTDEGTEETARTTDRFSVDEPASTATVIATAAAVTPPASSAVR